MTFGCDKHEMKLVHPMSVGGDEKYETWMCDTCRSTICKKLIVPESLKLNIYRRYFTYNQHYGMSYDNRTGESRPLSPEDPKLIHEILVDAIKDWNLRNPELPL